MSVEDIEELGPRKKRVGPNTVIRLITGRILSHPYYKKTPSAWNKAGRKDFASQNPERFRLDKRGSFLMTKRIRS